MYIHFNSLVGIRNYLAEKNHFIFVKAESDIDLLQGEGYKCEVEKGMADILVSWSDYVILSNTNIQKTLILKSGKTIRELNSYFHTNNNDILVLQRRDGKERFIDFYDKHFNVINSIEQKVGKPFLFDNNYVFTEFLKASAISILNLQTKDSKKISIVNYRWVSSENEFNDGKIWQILGQWNNQLLVFIGKFRILSIDLNTGEVLWRIEDFLEEVSNDKTLTFTKSKRIPIEWQLDTKQDKAYLLVRNYIFELNLEEKKSQLLKDFNEDGKLEWDFKNSRICGELISFAAANKLGAFPNVVGVIDKNTKEILWTTKCEPGVYFEEAPQIKDDKLYVLDSNKVLHIFEKEI